MPYQFNTFSNRLHSFNVIIMIILTKLLTKDPFKYRIFIFKIVIDKIKFIYYLTIFLYYSEG
jgi:hypothetical protein